MKLPSIQPIMFCAIPLIAIATAAPRIEVHREYAPKIELHRAYAPEPNPERVILPSLNPTSITEPIDDNRHRVPVTPHIIERRTPEKVRRQSSVAAKVAFGAIQGLASGGSSLAGDHISDDLTGDDGKTKE